jgi:hypothetical protein
MTIPMSMSVHVHVHSACACPCPCSMSLSMQQSMSMVHVHVHGNVHAACSCPCPCCMSMFMLNVHVQCLMDALLSSCTFISLDDILIFSNTREEHCAPLLSAHCFDSNGLHISLTKCTFVVSEVDFLGHHVTSKSLSPLLPTTTNTTSQFFSSIIHTLDMLH